MRNIILTTLVVLSALGIAPRSLMSAEPQQVTVYHEPGRFGGWPANHGMWAWGNELLVGFGAGYYKDNGPKRHAIDHDKPEEHLLARSLDGGETWKIENPAAKGALIPRGKALHGKEVPGLVDKPWIDCPGGIDFTHPDFAMTLRMSDSSGGVSRFYYSLDRGHNWQGPFKFPMLGLKGVAARTDYVVMGLFGTVWGIYHALLSIGAAGQATIDKVAGPIGESLIMTALGLAVAIPAVLGYNALVRGNKGVLLKLNRFAHDLHAYFVTGARVKSNKIEG